MSTEPQGRIRRRAAHLCQQRHGLSVQSKHRSHNRRTGTLARCGIGAALEGEEGAWRAGTTGKSAHST